MAATKALNQTFFYNEVTTGDHSGDQNSSGGVGYFSSGRGFSVESTLQGILSDLLLCKQNDWSVEL